MNTARVLLLCAALPVSACHRDSEAPAPPNPLPAPQASVPVVKKGPTAEALTAGMVEASSQGKSRLAVQLKFELPQRPMLGQPLLVNIAVLPQIDGNSAEIQVTGGDGLTLAPGANQIDLPALEAGQVYSQSFTVTPSAEGVLVLSLTVSVKHDDVAEARVFSIPLIVER
ncbi:MAG: hypothetical protein ABJD53_01490 [Gammaproteobacteria bacterium]